MWTHQQSILNYLCCKLLILLTITDLTTEDLMYWTNLCHISQTPVHWQGNLQPSAEKKNRLSLYIIHCYQKQTGANHLQNNLSFLSAGNSRIHNNKLLNNVQQDLNYMWYNDGCFTHRQESTNWLLLAIATFIDIWSDLWSMRPFKPHSHCSSCKYSES